ncbi:DMT family transporter [Limisalsivibrio acetivorans]|uniref:DMT family transporter n=1 Tax=Limisalsivibrio acetivorans TaxID=1304888 RepID=UPI00040733C9|nr:DMT family transporter [Limisalsivibrio acetivorans]
MNKPTNETAGVLIMLLASALFATMGYFVKRLGETHGTGEIVFFRNLIALMVLLPGILMHRSEIKGGRPFLLALRGLFGFAALFAYFHTITIIPLATAATFMKTAPLFTALLAWIFLKEKSDPKIWFSVVAGFIGIMLILDPGSGVHITGALLGLFAGFMAASAYTSIRQLRSHYPPSVIVASFAVFGVIGPSIIYAGGDFGIISQNFHRMLFHSMPGGIEWFFVLAVGLLATISQYLMTKAYALGRASVIATSSYSSLVFASIAGYMAGDALPDISDICGIILVALSGIIVGVSTRNGGKNGTKRSSNNEGEPPHTGRARA